MGLPVYDFRDDIRSVLVTPRIRSRFMQLEPGTAAEPHSHDLGHEVFIAMQGRAIFEIGAGDRAKRLAHGPAAGAGAGFSGA